MTLDAAQGIKTLEGGISRTMRWPRTGGQACLAGSNVREPRIDVRERQLRDKRQDRGADNMKRTRSFVLDVPLELWQEMSGAYRSTEQESHPDVSHQKVYAHTIGPEFNTRTSPYQARLTGPVQFLMNLRKTWELNFADMTVLLGMDPDDGSFVKGLLTGRDALRGRDARDRVAYLYRIRKTLSALFRDKNVENQWLREPHAMLNERSPMDLMLDGSMENLLLVKEYVEAAAGH